MAIACGAPPLRARTWPPSSSWRAQCDEDFANARLYAEPRVVVSHRIFSVIRGAYVTGQQKHRRGASENTVQRSQRRVLKLCSRDIDVA